MNLLLDTNALVWLTDNKKLHNLGKETRRYIDRSPAVYASSISIVELHIKSMLGKMKMVDNLAEEITQIGIILMNFQPNHADAITNFPSLSRHDPFDRMILAQAITEGLTLVTSDKILLGLGLSYAIDARK